MSISDYKIKEINNSTGFNEDLIEKVLRLEELLEDIFKHPYLRKRMLLKGGTALNFCYFDRPRLSVDIDLNYVGDVDLMVMKRERPKIEEAIIRILSVSLITLRSLYKLMMNGSKGSMGSGDLLLPKSYKNSWSVETLPMGSLVYAATTVVMSISWHFLVKEGIFAPLAI